MRILLAGATGVIGRQAVPVLAGAGHHVIGLANRPARLPGADVAVADALDPAAVAGAVRSAAPDVIVHMLTAIPDPIDPRHLARDMALTNRLRTEGTANLVAAAGGAARIIAQGVAYAYDPAGPPVKDEDAPLWHEPPTSFAPVVAALRDMERRVASAGGLVLRLDHLYGPGSSFAPRRWPGPAARRRQAPADRRRRLDVLLHPRPRRGHRDPGRRPAPGGRRGAQHRRRPAHPWSTTGCPRWRPCSAPPPPGTFPPGWPGCWSAAGAWPS
jgi:nucleoside-diphosphate-sugar epimerase